MTRLRGWRFNIPTAASRPELERCVMIMAPHTSVSDFFLGAACLWKLGVNFRIFMKKEYFTPVMGPMLRRIGVVPVDRGNRSNGLVQQAVAAFGREERFVMVITPEGTRKATRHWKRGFYEIAREARVPIVLTYIDYGKREMGVGPVFEPTDEWETDIRAIKDYYRNVTARHPEDFCAD